MVKEKIAFYSPISIAITIMKLPIDKRVGRTENNKKCIPEVI